MRNLLRTVGEKIDPAHTALLVVDVQNDMCHSDGAFAQMGIDIAHLVAVVPKIAKLAATARGAGVLTIYTVVSDHEEAAISDAYFEINLTFYERANSGQSPAPEPVEATDTDWGIQLFEPLSPADDDFILIKHRFGAFTNTKLDQILRSSNIKTVVLSGVLTDVCVESTARSAIDQDYYVIIVDDCVATLTDERQRSSLAIMENIIGTITNLEEISRIWKKR